MDRNSELDRRFEHILKDTQSRIRAYIAGMGVPVDGVDDIAQEVYLLLYHSMDKMPEGIEPVRWLKGIARNLSLNHFRREKTQAGRQREAVAEILARVHSATEDVPEDDAARRALEACLGKLPEKHRALVALRYEKGLVSEAIARTTATTAEAVRIALLRARNALRDCITRTLAQEG